jgi:hypothetical protein
MAPFFRLGAGRRLHGAFVHRSFSIFSAWSAFVLARRVWRAARAIGERPRRGWESRRIGCGVDRSRHQCAVHASKGQGLRRPD